MTVHTTADRESRSRLLSLSFGSIGFGTRGGRSDDETDERYYRLILEAALRGARLFDTAADYRQGRSEKVLGRALVEIRRRRREDPSVGEPIVCSKGAMDATATIEDQVETSLTRLGLERIDLYYLDGLEKIVSDQGASGLAERLVPTLERLEKLRQNDRIRWYGVSSRTGLLRELGDPEFLSLQPIVEMAWKVGGSNHGFGAVQSPYSISLPGAFVDRNQMCSGTSCSLIRAAEHMGVSFMAAEALGGGKALDEGDHPWLAGVLSRSATAAERAIQFVRSTPGVTACLVGTGRLDHLMEDLALLQIAPASKEIFDHLVPPEAPQVPWLY